MLISLDRTYVLLGLAPLAIYCINYVARQVDSARRYRYIYNVYNMYHTQGCQIKPDLLPEISISWRIGVGNVRKKGAKKKTGI